ncbi:MAG TPA: circadian clock protein KaiC [Polyangiaceae bacterium]|jgi:circadian clock protein KaiC|nr:circadian clock protein KaiC [Polyangiaceae bacterium]
MATPAPHPRSAREKKTRTRRSSTRRKPASPRALEKTPSGVSGLDRLTYGGLPRGRPTLICGGPGSGKTLFAMQFLVRGATEHGEPGVMLSFEETPEDLAKNFSALGFDLDALVAKKKLLIDYVAVERSEIEETGQYDLQGLFVRLQAAVDAIGAKRVVIDTLETIFTGFSDEGLLRAELRRLFRWLKDRKLTAVITGERGEGTLTRYGLEEYISDCVVFLDQTLVNQVATRRMRIVKYRGTSHGTNEYPFLVDEGGITVMPITAVGLDYPVTRERVVTGVPRLDAMLGGSGYYRGTAVLVSGTAGTGKTSLAAHFAEASCRSGETVVYFALEEPQSQIIRNMRSIGIDLEKWVKRGRLIFHAARPTLFGLEQHLVAMHKVVEDLKPTVVILDPISSLEISGDPEDVKTMAVRLFDYFKMNGITSLLTYLSNPSVPERTEVGISSLIDTWIQVRDVEHDGERNRALNIMKSRGMPHSNQVREFLITSRGVDLIDVYVGTDGVLTGSARVARARLDQESAADRRRAIADRRAELDARRSALKAQIEALQAQLVREERELSSDVQREERTKVWRDDTREEMRKSRHGVRDATPRNGS